MPVFAMLMAFALGAAEAAPMTATAPWEIVLTGEVREGDLNHYLERPFIVPAGVDRVTVRFEQDGAAQRTTIDLGLRDPDRFRGWSGGEKQEMTVGRADATPSYLPGPIPAGTWRLVMGVPNIRKGVVTHYRATIGFGKVGATPASSHFSNAPLRSGPGWYRGDLHMHTGHSDGHCPSRSGRTVPCPTFRTVEAAQARGLDFIVVSDHNTVSQAQDLRALQAYYDQTLLIPGSELTTFHGHGNAIGLVDPVDFRVDGEHVNRAEDMIRAVHALGALFSVNHPTNPSGEVCMGCGWTAPDFDWTSVDAMEVVNGGSMRATGRAEGPLSGWGLWESLLGRGLHITAVGGSDNHTPELSPDEPGSIGYPSTVVFAENLSERAILQGVKAGRVFIDIIGSRDRVADLSAVSSTGQIVPMGGTVEMQGQRRVRLQVAVSHLAGGRAELVQDGKSLASDALSPRLTEDDQRQAMVITTPGARYIYLKVYDAHDRLSLITNPIFLH